VLEIGYNLNRKLPHELAKVYRIAPGVRRAKPTLPEPALR
jgi:hypothetical protein